MFILFIYIFFFTGLRTASHDVRPAHAVVGTGLVPGGLATAFAAPQGGRVPHANEL